MSESKVFMFPDSYGNGNHSNGIDPALLMALNNGGGFGNNGNWMWIFFLWFLWPMFGGNGFGPFGNNGGNGASGGFGNLANMLNNDTGRELLMQAINHNGDAISQLANMFGCKSDTIIQAINGVTSQIQSVGSQLGMSTQQVINAVQSGNCQLGQQIAQCCCENRLAICQQTNTLQTAINTVATGQERGFAAIGTEIYKQTCGIEKTVADAAEKIVAGQRAAEMRELNRDITERDRLIAKQDVIINNAQQTAVFGQMIQQATAPVVAAVGALQKDVDGIKCKLPETATVPYSPVVGIPTCTAAQFGLNALGLNGLNLGNGSIWA